MRRTSLSGLIAAAAMAVAAGCVRPPPVVDVSDVPPAPSALERVAIAPFAAGPALAEDPTRVELVERFVTEAIAGVGIQVIPAQEIRIAFSAQGREPPLEDLAALTKAADRDFRATSLLRGRVTRFRERAREDAQNPLAASVAFELSLHAVPSGRRLWTARFEETQVDLSTAPAQARRYPGAGTRWLSAGELARWGADNVAAELVRR
jgi:hypothetical protein